MGVRVFFGKFGNIRNIYMKLTRRQEEFIVNLIELNRELDGPIHYSILAERLGVSPFTAYDMLCVLEEKGKVSSEYQLAAGKSGPGRAERLFFPVLAVAERETRPAQKVETAVLDEAGLKRLLMEETGCGRIPNKDEAEELLARIPPESPGNTGYCAEVMTVVALRLRERAGQEKLIATMPQLLATGDKFARTNLALLGGFAFGLLVQEESGDGEWSQMLLEHVRQYQALVMGMTADEIAQLADALLSVFAPQCESLIVEMEAV
jgi:hypothetical protein